MIPSPSGWMSVLQWVQIKKSMSNTWPLCSAWWPRKSWWSGQWLRYSHCVRDGQFFRSTWLSCDNVACVWQNLTFKEQLDAGIRYFDLRVSSKPGEPGTEIYFIHGLFGHKVSRGCAVHCCCFGKVMLSLLCSHLMSIIFVFVSGSEWGSKVVFLFFFNVKSLLLNGHSDIQYVCTKSIRSDWSLEALLAVIYLFMYLFQWNTNCTFFTQMMTYSKMQYKYFSLIGI